VSGGNSEIEAKNKAAIEQADRNIEEFRKANAVIKLSGFKQKNVQIKIRQLTHSFKFGCYLKLDDLPPSQHALYEKYFNRLFNYAVIGTYWDVTENKRGEHFWTNFENEVAMAKRNNWQIQAAPILWGTNQAGTPNWLPNGREELREVLNQRVKRFFENYQNIVTDVEIVNEPLAPTNDLFAKRTDKFYLDAAFGQAKKAAPNSRLILNEYGVFGSVAANNYNYDKYYNLVNELKDRNVPFEIVGIQAHANREWYSPADVWEKLNRYAELGKPIQISEFSAQTRNYEDRTSREKIIGNYRSGVWNDELQAEFYREFYTLAFGHPQVEAIVQWGLDDVRAWLPGIGLIDKNGSPKPNFQVLDDLINRQWRTNLQINVNTAKNTEFRGFLGVYEIQVVADNKVLRRETVELKKDTKNEFTLSEK
jgi:GH35 family endo-1,4-beta-xylanase